MDCPDKLPKINMECVEDLGISIDKLKVTTPENYSELHGVSLKTVYNRIKRGELQTVKMFKKTLIVV